MRPENLIVAGHLPLQTAYVGLLWANGGPLLTLQRRWDRSKRDSQRVGSGRPSSDPRRANVARYSATRVDYGRITTRLSGKSMQTTCVAKKS